MKPMSPADAEVARFVVFSLNYATRDQINDDVSARAFFQHLRATVSPHLLPSDYDIDRMIDLARLGQNKLEKMLEVLD